MLAQAQPKPNGIVFRRWSLLLKELKTLLFKAHEPLISPLRVDAIVAVASPSAPPTAGHGSAPLDGSQSGSPNLSGSISRRKTIQTFKVALLADSDARKGFNDYLVLNNPSKSHRLHPVQAAIGELAVTTSVSAPSLKIFLNQFAEVVLTLRSTHPMQLHPHRYVNSAEGGDPPLGHSTTEFHDCPSGLGLARDPSLRRVPTP